MDPEDAQQLPGLYGSQKIKETQKIWHQNAPKKTDSKRTQKTTADVGEGSRDLEPTNHARKAEKTENRRRYNLKKDLKS